MFRRHGHLDEAVEHEGATDQERQIIEALRDLRDTTVREVMTPRVDVAALSIPVRADDIVQAVRETGHRCFPVYDDDLDKLVGVLWTNELFRSGWQLGEGGQVPGTVDISRRLRQPYIVPESRLVLDVLTEMRERKRAFAVVVDEFGSVSGVLTVKDILGRLVGNLRDEFDQAGEPEITRVDRKRWLVDGSTNIDDVRARLGIAIPDGEYVTLGGFLFEAFGRIPEEGESLRHERWDLRVTEMDRRRIAKVLVRAPSATIDDETGGTSMASERLETPPDGK